MPSSVAPRLEASILLQMTPSVRHHQAINPFSIMKKEFLLVWAFVFAMGGHVVAEKQRVLIVDGQNNHGMWPKTTVMMKRYLEESGLFEVQVARSAYTWQGAEYIDQYPIEGLAETKATPKPIPDPNFAPDFDKYDAVLVNFGWNAAPWPEATKARFEAFVKRGGGVLIVHAADNSFPQWPAYNEMIGLGGWGDRNEKSGPYVYLDDEGEVVRDTSPGRGGSHGPQHEFTITVRRKNHPITKGMPTSWLHAQDELYDRLRGPAKRMKILATTYSSKDKSGTGRHEPMLITVRYGKGRIFHTPMGHADYSVECVGFITSLVRGAEWVTTGKVTFPIPDDFPSAEKVSQRKFD